MLLFTQMLQHGGGKIDYAFYGLPFDDGDYIEFKMKGKDWRVYNAYRSKEWVFQDGNEQNISGKWQTVDQFRRIFQTLINKNG